MAAIEYDIFVHKGPPNGTNYITQKEKLPLGAFETALREKGIGYE